MEYIPALEDLTVTMTIANPAIPPVVSSAALGELSTLDGHP